MLHVFLMPLFGLSVHMCSYGNTFRKYVGPFYFLSELDNTTISANSFVMKYLEIAYLTIRTCSAALSAQEIRAPLICNFWDPY